MNALTVWAQQQPLAAAAAAVLLLAAAVLRARAVRRASDWPPAAVVVASLAAMACTAYSADTSWRFAADYLGMTTTGERAAMFAAAELALFACALMARQNLRGPQKAPGAPGVLVWVITGVQVIPAYSESGPVGGTVRAVVGPVLAALLWHLAMGIELRHAKPGTESGSLPALIAREARERLLSYLGLAVRDRTAEQITRDRWTVKAVALAARLAEKPEHARGRARLARCLSVAVGKAQAGADDEQRARLLQLLAARRHAAALATITLPSPWQDDRQDVAEPEPVPSARPLPAAVPAGARMLPIVAPPATGDMTTGQPPHPRYRGDHIRGPLVEAEPQKVVIPPVTPLSPWADKPPLKTTTQPTPAVTGAVPAAQPRQVVTEVVTLTPSDLRRKARALHREAVRSTNKPVTIKTLQDELHLSRREATDLRRDILEGDRS